jgi:uncharacterized protein YbjQ (UPF0145 family)
MADEPKKDLTGIMEVSRQMAESGSLPPPPEGAILEEQKIEKIDDFESLADYSKSNPAAEPPPENEFAVSPPPPPEPTAHGGAAAAAPFPTDTQFPTTQESADFPVSPDSGPAPDAGAGFTGAVTGAHVDNPLGMDGLADAIPNAQAPPPEQLAGLDPTAGAPAAAPEPLALAPEPEPMSHAPPAPAPMPAADLPANSASVSVGSDDAASELSPIPDDNERAHVLPVSRSAPPLTPLERVKEFSEHVVVGKPAVPASLPFSLLIEGRLSALDRERLLDVLSREKVGIREMDLEPQFAGDRVLIPRISEYAGILLVQALRGARARIRLGPSDTIFATDDTRMKAEDEAVHPPGERAEAFTTEVAHPAESMPVTPDALLPSLPVFVVVDAVTASAALKTSVVEAERSSQYQEILEALQRELKYKAYRKGATAVVNFSVTLTQLGLPTHYRLTAMGSAVKAPG